MRPSLRLLLMPAVALVTLASFLVPDAALFQRPELARIFFWHFPCAIFSTVMLLAGAWGALQHLRTGDAKWDVRSAAANELAMVFIVLTLATGVLFSKVQWGEWWQRDPRQTSFLLVVLVCSAYFALRSALSDPQRRARQSAVYALMALAPTLFLIFVFPQLPQIKQASFHPSDSILSGSVKGSYAYVVTATLVTFALLSRLLYTLRVRAGLLELETEKDGQLEARRGGAADPRVVRPVRIPGARGS